MGIDDLTGLTFNFLTALSRNGSAKGGQATWLCKCVCGKEKIYAGFSLKQGNTKSCGCMKNSLIRDSRTKHGLSNTTEFKTWTGIKNRCLNANSKDYKSYGGNGIKVCDRWINSFENFINDMGLKPSKNHSIDRINNEEGYSKQNCRWALPVTQNSNRKSNVFYEGKTMAEWGRILGISIQGISYRMKKFNNPYGAAK